MLDCHAETVPTVDEIGQLPCTVRLPVDLQGNFELRGLAPPLPGCKRRFARVRCRSKESLVALEYRQTLPCLARAHAWYAAYLTDLGRGGVGLLHGDQLYPGERFGLLFSNKVQRLVEIVRCIRIDDRCFSIGAAFVEEC